MINLLWRIGYWAAFRAARLVWRIQRPKHAGAVLAGWLGNEILVVRQSYRSVPYWPGGGVSAGESPLQAIRRELKEELDIDLSQHELRLACEMDVQWEYRHEHVSVFETFFESAPRLHIDRREIVAAEFVDPLPLASRADLPPYMHAYLADWARRSST